MFFEDHLKRVYTPAHPKFSTPHDPLRVDLVLTVESGNRLNELVTLRNTARQGKGEETGDVSPGGRREAAVEGARAELELARIARVAFGLPPGIEECTDADCLEVLYDYLGWMEGKGSKAGTPQESYTTSPAH